MKQDIERQKSLIETRDEEIGKEMLKKDDNGTLEESLRRKIELKEDGLKERKIVNKGGKNSNNLKQKIDERLKSIERSMIETHQNDSLAELIKKIEILNAPLDLNRTRDITVLNITNLSNNERTDRHVTDKHVRNTICHKCKEYGHTKKQCDRHKKNIKRISKLEFEKDIINEFLEIFNVNQKEIDQVKKMKELKSTSPLKINKRKRKQKDIMMKLIENLLDHHKDKKDYFLKLKDSIEIPIACIKCRKYGHHVTECGKEEKTKKKEKEKDIKSVTLQDLMTEAKMVKQKIK